MPAGAYGSIFSFCRHILLRMMIVYSKQDIASENAANSLREAAGFSELGSIKGHAVYGSEGVRMLELDTAMVDAGFLDDIVETDLLVFLSKHRSEKGVASFTVHAEGNWSGKADLGGVPRQLSYSSPARMLAVLAALKRAGTDGLDVVYEATHHGPLLVTPSMFIEVGGNDGVIADKRFAAVLANAAKEALVEKRAQEFDTVAVGIGGMHYSQKFTRLALEGKYAFAHIMPKYYVAETGMLAQAFTRSDMKPEKAVIEWKSINAAERDSVIRGLGELGIDYDRV